MPYCKYSIDDEELIGRVKQFSELYDFNHRRYINPAHKEMIWQSIGNALNQPASHCKNRWISIRDQFRKALRKRKATGLIKRWKYEDSMAFVIPFLRERSANGSSAVVNALSMENYNNETVSDENEMNSKQEIEELSSTSTQLLSPCLEAIKDEKTNVQPKDAVNSFFHAIAATVKHFSPIRQHEAKTRIFEIISQLEFEEIQETIDKRSTDLIKI